MTIVLRATKGSNLTPPEVDGNFTDLDGRVTSLEAASSTGVGIDYIVVTGTQMTIHMTDHSMQGPFTLPTAAPNPRGEWAATTAYAVYDVFTYFGDTYLVIFGHTSGSSFDPNANDGAGHDYYFKIASSTVSKVQTHDVSIWEPSLSDWNTYNRFTNPSACILRVPTNTNVPFPIGTEIHGRQAGTGAVSVEALSGDLITINVPVSHFAISAGEGATFTLKKVGTDEWDLMGLLSTSSP